MSPPPRPSASNPALAAFDAVIAKGMAKKPEDRYQSAAELGAAARRALTTPVSRAVRGAAHRAPARPRRRVSGRLLTIAGVGVVVAVVCAVAAWQWWGDRGPGRPAVWPTRRRRPVRATRRGSGEVDRGDRARGISDSGRLLIGVNVPYAPNEFKNSEGQIVGFDVDMMTAVTRTLGLVPDYRETSSKASSPRCEAAASTSGCRRSPTPGRASGSVDFVDYFQAGTLWAQRAGSSVDPDAACGLRVGVAYGTIQETEEIGAKSDQCVAAGLSPIDKVVYTSQDDVTKALIAGDIDAMSADSPVTGFAIKLSAGALQAAGEVFDSAPYGWPVAKDSGLAEPLRRALEHVMSTGQYRTIATMWGVEKGMIDKPVVNAAAK